MNPNIESALKLMEQEIKLRHYSPKTKKNYLRCAQLYLEQKSDLVFSQAHLKNYLVQKLDAGAAPETVNLHLNAIKFFYLHVRHVRSPIAIRFARRNLKLPVVLPRGVLQQMLALTKNIKHRFLLSLAYASGLRVNEAVHLKKNDFDWRSGLLRVRIAKGGRERISLLPKELQSVFEEIYGKLESNFYVFKGRKGGSLSTRSAQKIFKQALERASPGMNASFHSLRHSFASHLLENGTDIRIIQELLGHANIRTTERYTQISRSFLTRIQSPLQELVGPTGIEPVTNRL